MPETARRPRVGDLVEIVAIPKHAESIDETSYLINLINRRGQIVEAHDYATAHAEGIVDFDALYDVKVPGYTSFPFTAAELKPVHS